VLRAPVLAGVALRPHRSALRAGLSLQVNGIRESMAARLFTRVVWLYQLLISPLLPPSCRFYPSCSAYAIQATAKYGFWKGLRLAGWRLLRCHPLHAGGWDPVE